MVIIPLFISRTGEAVFRYPKELALRVEVLAIVAVLSAAWGFGRIGLAKPRIGEKWLVLLLLICGWTIISAICSANPQVAGPPIALVLEYGVLFVMTVAVLRRRSLRFAGFIVPAAVLNAIVYLLQETEIWRPFEVSSSDKHLTRTALIGNPNDVGSYLVAPALVATALALTRRREWVLWGSAAAMITVATFATETVGAIGALIVGLLVIFPLALRSWRLIVVAVLAVAGMLAAGFLLYPPLRARAVLMRTALAGRDYDTLLAARSIPFMTAAAMVHDHPLTGVGPGGFAYEFFDYKLRAQAQHRWLFRAGASEYNFGEVHNDHLQVAAETGLPGYALLLTATILVSLGSWRRRTTSYTEGDDGRGEYVRILATPLAVSFLVLALVQFPLELVAPASSYLFAASTVIAWRES